MIELKLKCYSCDYERIVGEREFIEDLQQCTSCDSDKIEIVPTGNSYPERNLSERARIIRNRLNVIGIISIIMLLLSFAITLTVYPLFGIPFTIIGILCLVVVSVVSLLWS